ncbi:hypothetical protein [Corynebacterium antarcticum]|uniref:hypothetical protein n=1 Tax=Corynebacterium antarcticum TaxID=2800405 RepID=UPI002005E096|nr:hypothetical protein [Corynebacterium antarcticum]MCK7660489.1 hypothetical protein [Corynebacterium antarcticum]MCX7539803.1 hypothetical protein [Corynebacterium antarcticum]
MTSTPISQQFSPVVDEFIDDLETFATGSYLGKDEKEFWEQPFDPAVLPELRRIIDGFLNELDRLPDPPDADAVTAVITRFITAVETFNAHHGDAVIEPEEFEELNSLITGAVTATGFTPPETEEAEDSFELPAFD